MSPLVISKLEKEVENGVKSAFGDAWRTSGTRVPGSGICNCRQINFCFSVGVSGQKTS